MPTIGFPSSLYTVIVSVDADVHAMPHLERHARAGLEQFGGFEGFVGGALHKSVDGTRLIQYLQWQTEAQYKRCIDDPVWETFPSTRRFMELVATEKARLDARTFEVLATAPSHKSEQR